MAKSRTTRRRLEVSTVTTASTAPLAALRFEKAHHETHACAGSSHFRTVRIAGRDPLTWPKRVVPQGFPAAAAVRHVVSIGRVAP